MTVPKKVLEAEERANQLHKELYEAGEPKDEERQDGEESPEEPVEQAAEEEGAAAPDTVGDAHAQDDAEHERLKQAHAALQGKYNAEVPRMAAQIRDLEAKLKDALRDRDEAKREAKTAKDELKERIDSLRGEYGDSIADVISEIADRNVETQPQSSGVITQDQVDRFWRSIRRAIPDFDSINSSTAFVTWLQKPDTATGLPMQQTLNDAGSDLDAYTVVQIVKRFQQENTKREQPNPNDQIAPKRKPRAEPVSKPAYTIDDFVKLQRDIQAGHYIGREVEARELEKQIHAALTGE